MVKKEIKLEKSRVSFWLINSNTKISLDTLFSKNDNPEQYFKKKTFPEKSNYETFKEIKNAYWATVPVAQVNQDAAALTPLSLWEIMKKQQQKY